MVFAGPGAEPLTIGTAQNSLRCFAASKLAIKAALLNQSLLAGVGNIYADESLFRAGIRPRRQSRPVDASGAGAAGVALRKSWNTPSAWVAHPSRTTWTRKVSADSSSLSTASISVPANRVAMWSSQSSASWWLDEAHIIARNARRVALQPNLLFFEVPFSRITRIQTSQADRGPV